MPEYIRALIVIIVLSAFVFKYAESSATAIAITPTAYVRRRNTWIYLTLAVFLSQNIWIFCILTAIVVYKAAKNDTNKIALFIFLLLAIPEINIGIPGFGIINYFFIINHQRILVAVILVPILLHILKSTGGEKTLSINDKILLTYFLLNIALMFQYVTLTEWLRYLVGWVLDVLVPYFVISRSVTSLEKFRETIMAFVVGAMVISLLGMFEYARHWLLYQSIGNALGVDIASSYLGRGESLRALVTTGQPIILGYVLTIALGMYLCLRRNIPNTRLYLVGLTLLCAGNVASLSKGPWVGALITVLVYIALGPRVVAQLTKLFLAVLLVGLILAATGNLDSVIKYLPFVGDLDEGSLDYRKLILEKSIDVIFQNPFFGSNDFLLNLEDLRQGQGIIDLVNIYVIVALKSGLIGLALFSGIFASVALLIYRSMRTLPIDSELREIGQALLGAIGAILVMISAVSEVWNVPIMYWSFVALGVAYSNICLNLSNNLKNTRYQVTTKDSEGNQ